MDTNKKKGQEALAEINKILKENGLLELALVSPNDCLPQKVNARYFSPEKFQILVDNIKNSGMESVPLVIRSKTKKGKYEIISGHHRVDAAKHAKKELILVLVTSSNLSRDEITAKQLSHNALVGMDDKALLAELFQSITDVELKLSTGLNDEIEKIQYDSLNFRVGTFREFTVLFLPEDEGITDEAMEVIASELNVKSDSSVRVTSVEYWERFANAIRKIKKVENIKSNGTAFMRMVELAEQEIQKVKNV